MGATRRLCCVTAAVAAAVVGVAAAEVRVHGAGAALRASPMKGEAWPVIMGRHVVYDEQHLQLLTNVADEIFGAVEHGQHGNGMLQGMDFGGGVVISPDSSVDDAPPGDLSGDRDARAGGADWLRFAEAKLGNQYQTCTRHCRCLAAEMLHTVTRGDVPYKPWGYRNGNKVYKFKAVLATPLWFECRWDGASSRYDWWWTPYQPPTNDWSHTSSTSAKGWVSIFQAIGLTDVAPVNKEIIDAMLTFRPKCESSVPSTSTAATGKEVSARANEHNCYNRYGVADHCLCHKYYCVSDVASRLGKIVELQRAAVAQARMFDAVVFWAKLALDLAGLIPGIGFVFDLLNAGISALQGMWVDAVLCALAAIPAVGHIVGGLKVAVKLGSRGSKLASALRGISKMVRKVLASPPVRALFNKLGRLAKSANNGLNKVLGELKVVGQQFLRISKLFRGAGKTATKIKRMTSAAKFGDAAKDILNLAKNLGCGSKVAKWALTVTEGVAKVFSNWGPFIKAATLVKLVIPCFRICTESSSPREITESINTCVFQSADAIFLALNGDKNVLNDGTLGVIKPAPSDSLPGYVAPDSSEDCKYETETTPAQLERQEDTGVINSDAYWDAAFGEWAYV